MNTSCSHVCEYIAYTGVSEYKLACSVDLGMAEQNALNRSSEG